MDLNLNLHNPMQALKMDSLMRTGPRIRKKILEKLMQS